MSAVSNKYPRLSPLPLDSLLFRSVKRSIFGKRVAEAIEPLGESEFRTRYNAIDEQEYGMPLSEEDFDYTWAYFTALRDFFQRAANANRSVVFSVDQ